MADVLCILKNISDLDCKFDCNTTSHNFPVSPGVGIHLRLARDGLNSNKWEERFAATTWLGRLAGSETSTVVELLRGLRDEHPCVRAGAVSSLAILHQASPQLPCCSASPQLPCYAQHEPTTPLPQLPCNEPTTPLHEPTTLLLNSLAILLQASPQRGGPMLRLSVQGLVALLDDTEVWVRLAARRALAACIAIATR